MSAATIRVLLVDDHALFREGLARLLGAEPDIEVVAHRPSIAAALQVLAEQAVDVVLLDVDLGNERGAEFLTRARAQGFQGAVLLVTAGIGEPEAQQLIARGAAGVFLKQDSVQLLSKGIRTVAEGRAWIDQRALRALVGTGEPAPGPDRERLTQREREVLRGVFDGLANKEIAARLSLSESAVKAVLQQLFDKAGVRTRSQLVRVALEQYPDLL